MSKPGLHIVTPDEAAETVSQRVRRLQAEAQTAATEHVAALAALMAATQATAAEIAEGGGVYHVGAQELARRIADGLASQITILRQITERNT